MAADLFAMGLIVSAVVALPIIMSTTAYVVGAQFDWRRGLSEPVKHAKNFYLVLTASIGLSFAVTLGGVSVISMLVSASVIAAFGTPVGLVVLVLLARDQRVMGSQIISGRLAVAGWTVAGIVAGFGLLLVIGTVLAKF
jgi:Mn2+/Fe2+ NRAMP family transporter